MTETVQNEIQGILNAFMKPDSLDLVAKAMTGVKQQHLLFGRNMT